MGAVSCAWPHSSLEKGVRQGAYAATRMCPYDGGPGRPGDFGDVEGRVGGQKKGSSGTHSTRAEQRVGSAMSPAKWWAVPTLQNSHYAPI